MKNMTVSKALKWIFIAQILSIIGNFIFGGILGIIAFVLNLVALYGAGKLEKGYDTAFVLSLLGIVLSALGLINSVALSFIAGIAATVAELAILYFVITTTCNLLESSGFTDIAQKGYTVWKINLICTIAVVVLMLLLFIVPVIASLLTIVVGIVALVGGILYLVFLYRSYNVL